MVESVPAGLVGDLVNCRLGDDKRHGEGERIGVTGCPPGRVVDEAQTTGARATTFRLCHSILIIARVMVDLPYMPRVASGLLERALAASPVVVLMGARQTGKSTLAQSEPFIEIRLYLTLDDLEVRERARMAAGDLVRSAPRLTLDEVQQRA